MAPKLMGRKRGMIQLFDDKGNSVTCTVIEVEPNIVTQIKTKEKDGYTAIQLGFDEVKVNDPRTVVKRLGKPVVGHFKANNIAPRRYLHESRMKSTDEFQLGQTIGVGVYASVKFVDTIAISKGKGYQGVIKRHNFSGGPAAHGSGFHRHAGSTGMRSSPGRGLPGGKKAGHMGSERKTIQNLEVFLVDDQANVLVVKGAVPGPKGGVVYIQEAKKKLADQTV